MTASIEEVARNRICTACGTCAGACPREAVAMVELPDGRLGPRVSGDRCNSCGLCLEVCPALHMPAALAQGDASQPRGACLEGYLARARDPQLAAAGQSGGAVRALLAWALQSRLVDHVVITRPVAGDPLHVESSLLEDPAQLPRMAGSSYCPVPVNRIIRDILHSQGRTAFVGLGCQMQGLARACEVLAALGAKIPLRVGLFCSGTMNFGAQDFLTARAGARREDVRRFVYRDKATGWPGDVLVQTADGTQRHLPTELRTAGKSLFIPLYCRLCVDKMNLLADLVVGDAYGLCDDATGLAEVLVRGETGRQAVRGAVADGFLHAQPHDWQDLVRRQAARSYARRSAGMASAWRRAGLELPDLWTHEPYSRRMPARPSIAARAGLALMRRLQTAGGRRLLGRLPGWLVMGYSRTVRAMVWAKGLLSRSLSPRPK